MPSHPKTKYLSQDTRKGVLVSRYVPKKATWKDLMMKKVVELHHHQLLGAPLLGAPVLPASTGMSMKNALVQMLNVWDIHNEQIIALSWDTTASNTGHKTWSSTLFEQELQRSVMWLACHHIDALDVKHADIKVRGAWNGPSDKMFVNFRIEFPNLPADGNLRIWGWPEMERPYNFLAERAVDVLNFCQQHLLNESFGRDDYRELYELIIKFLGGQVINTSRAASREFSNESTWFYSPCEVHDIFTLHFETSHVSQCYISSSLTSQEVTGYW